MKAGDSIPIPPYGSAILCYYRELDCTYVLDLPFGKLYASRETIRAHAVALLPPATASSGSSRSCTSTRRSSNCMKLNEAYEALEKMRLLNLELTCQERGIPFTCLETSNFSSSSIVAVAAPAHQQCTACLLASRPIARIRNHPPPEKHNQQKPQQSQHESQSFLIPTVRFPRFSSVKAPPPPEAAAASGTTVFDEPESNTGISGGFSRLNLNRFVPKIPKTIINQNDTTTSTSSTSSITTQVRIKPGVPCLLCGSPVCSSHASKTFKQQCGNIDVCLSCEGIFGMDFVLDCLTLDKVERRKHVDRLLDSYDRTLLLLQYSSQFIPDIAASLEEATVRHNAYVGVGGSSAGILSGVLGIAAAATILTPAGPPLLLASLLFGGGASAVQTSAEVQNRYFSQPDKLADRIIALHAMLQAMVRIVGMLRDALLSDEFCPQVYIDDHANNQAHDFTQFMSQAYQQNKSGILAGFTAGRLGMAGMEIGGQLTSALTTTAAAEVGTLAGSSARFFSSNCASNLLRTARLARFAGGALSAATLLLETKSMTRTIADIRAGNPCEKAQQLRTILAQLEENDDDDDSYFPSSSRLDSECERYLNAMNQRERRMTQEEAVRLLLETATPPPPPVAKESPVQDEDDEHGDDDLESGRANIIVGTCTKKNDVMDKMSVASLLERIERFKRHQQEDTMASDKKAAVDDASRKRMPTRNPVTISNCALSTSINSNNDDASLSSSLLQRIERFKLRQAAGGGNEDDGSYDLSLTSYPLAQSDCDSVPLNIL